MGEFSAMDNAMANKLDKLLQEINSRNVMLFNNLKQINDAQSQHIIQQNELNYAKKVKAHECVLKNHLQTIAEKIGAFNKTQTAMQQTIKQQQPKIQQSEDKNGNFQQIISQSVSGLQKIIVSKIESTIQHFVEEKNEKIEANKEAIANMLKE